MGSSHLPLYGQGYPSKYWRKISESKGRDTYPFWESNNQHNRLPHSNVEEDNFILQRDPLVYAWRRYFVTATQQDKGLRSIKSCQTTQRRGNYFIIQNRRFKISLLIISILLLLLYGEIAIFFGWILKKKTKKLLLRIYWYGALVLLIGSLYREYRGTGNALVADKES